jgi:transcriptional regulator with PAS, ATPase and Fis domain
VPAADHAALQAAHAGLANVTMPVVVGTEPAGALGVVGALGLAPHDLHHVRDLLGVCSESLAEELTAQRGPAVVHDVRYSFDQLIGRARPMQELYRVLDKVVESETTVLIQGENGTGKELIARAIHFNSPRSGRRFVVQNCSAFNDNLLDSELFGHKKGAFTGAIADKQGLFEVADGGTFFLDEIGDMSPMLQVKLLRVLQEGTFIPVGDTNTRKVDVRIIAATNRDLKKMVDRSEFREDLFYRVNVINIVAPPLRDRKDDIPVLVEHFLKKHGRPRGKARKLSRGCLERLIEYAWPGNIRELENEIERLVVLAGEEKTIGEELLSTRIRTRTQGSPDAAAGGEPSGLPDAVAALERSMITEVLRRHHGNKTRAATELRISRRNLIRLVQKYKLETRRGAPGRV